MGSILQQVQYKQCSETKNRPSLLAEAFVVRCVLSEMNAFNVYYGDLFAPLTAL
jgi:hypothetical protein